MTTVAHSKEEYAQYIEGITDVMSYLGIDTSKDFTVNGMKYSKNKDGWYALIRSPRTSSALWLSCNSQSVQKATVPPLFPAGRTVVFLFIAIFKNSAYRDSIFAIGNSTLLLLH